METQSQLKIQDRPISFWIIGFVLAGTGIFIFAVSPGEVFIPLLLVLIGLAMFLLTSSLTITADRIAYMVRLEYHSPLHSNTREITFADISSIDLERSRMRGSYGYTYRIIIVLKDNNIVPLHSYYSSASKQMAQEAEQLRSFIGVAGVATIPADSLGQRPLTTQVAYHQQEATTGSEAQDHVTNGVHWRTQTITYGSIPVTRWFSPEFKMPRSFVYVTQKLHGQQTNAGGALSMLTGPLMAESLSIYGFQEDDTPDRDQAEILSQVDSRLQTDFTVYTSDPQGAQQTLNPWTVLPLSTWAECHPLKKFQRGGIGQLAILFGPNGVYVAVPGSLLPEQLDELKTLGVELVRAQGTQPTAAAENASW